MPHPWIELRALDSYTVGDIYRLFRGAALRRITRPEAMVSENSPDSPPPAPLSEHGFVAGIKAFTLWLGGSLAGITAMLYAAGYLVTRAHLNLLGLYGIVDFGNDYFIQEGAKFFLVIGYSYVLGVVLPLLAIAGLAATVLLALRLMLGRTVTRLGDKLKACFPRFGPDGMLRVAACAFLLFVFIVDADEFLAEFQVPLCVANLLYADPGSSVTTCGAAMKEKENAVKAAILNRNKDNRAALKGMFSRLVYATAKTALLTYLVWQVVRPWQRWRLWLVALPLVAVCFYGVSLLLDYAVLQRPVVYPRIKVTLAEESPFMLNSPLFLLSKTTGDFVIWDSLARKLFWVPSGSVKRVEVIGVDDLFAFRPDSRTNPEKNK